jgi:hypothetical protein
MPPAFRRLIVAILLLMSTAASPALAQQSSPVYSRMRQGADDWHARGGGYGYSFPSYMYGGYFAPLVPPVVVAQSWYQRPYPYHFDVARQRWGGPPPQQAYPQDMMLRTDCPCAEPSTPAPAD